MIETNTIPAHTVNIILCNTNPMNVNNTIKIAAKTNSVSWI